MIKILKSDKTFDSMIQCLIFIFEGMAYYTIALVLLKSLWHRYWTLKPFFGKYHFFMKWYYRKILYKCVCIDKSKTLNSEISLSWILWLLNNRKTIITGQKKPIDFGHVCIIERIPTWVRSWWFNKNNGFVQKVT